MKNESEQFKKALESEYYSYDYIQLYRTYRAFGKESRYLFCIVTDKENKKKLLRLEKRQYGVTKKMRDAGQTKPRWYSIGGYNINPKKDFPGLFTVLSKFKEGKLDEVREVVAGIDFDAQLNQIATLQKEFKKVVKVARPTKEQKAELSRKQEQIDDLSGKLLVLNDENRQLRLQSFKSNLETYRREIRQLRADLDAKPGDEGHFQRALTASKWIFGPWYEAVLPKRKADPENQPDFVLKRFDGFADVVEIEAPGKELFTKPDKSGKSQPREHLIQALTQVIDYVDSYNSNLLSVYHKDAMSGAQNPLNPYKPRGVLIIGRDRKQERQKLRQLNSFLNHVTIMTYDEFFLNGASMLDFVDKKKRN